MGLLLEKQVWTGWGGLPGAGQGVARSPQGMNGVQLWNGDPLEGHLSRATWGTSRGSGREAPSCLGWRGCLQSWGKGAWGQAGQMSGGHEGHSSLWGASRGSGWAGRGGWVVTAAVGPWVREAGEAVVPELEGLRVERGELRLGVPGEAGRPAWRPRLGQVPPCLRQGSLSRSSGPQTPARAQPCTCRVPGPSAVGAHLEFSQAPACVLHLSTNPKFPCSRR